MKEAVSRNARNWKYIDKILKDCRENHVKTVDQYRMRQKEFKAQRENNSKGNAKAEVTYNTDFSEYDKYMKGD